MPLSTYALITVAELRPALQGGHATDPRNDPTLEAVINDASAAVETYLDRHVITRGTITSYFTVPGPTPKLYPYDWPLISVTSIHEDSSRTYGASSLLTADVDYVVSRPADTYGYLTRTWSASGGTRDWLTGFRAIKVVYAAGYSTRDAVPEAIKRVARRLAQTTFNEWRKGTGDVSQESSPFGTATRFSAAFLTADMRRELDAYRRPPFWEDYEARSA